jgi:hypothetical protein
MPPRISIGLVEAVQDGPDLRRGDSAKLLISQAETKPARNVGRVLERHREEAKLVSVSGRVFEAEKWHPLFLKTL